MDTGSEVARPTTVESTNLGMPMNGAVQGGEAHMMSASTFVHGQLGAAATRRASLQAGAAAYHNYAEYVLRVRAAAGSGEVRAVAVFHREPAPGVAHANIGDFWRQLGPVGVVLVVVAQQLHDNYGYSAVQPRLGAGLGVMLAGALLSGGVEAVYNGDYALHPRPGAEHGEVLGDLLPVPDGVGHGEVFGEVLLGVAVYAVDDYYGYYPWQPRLGAGRGQVFIFPLPDGSAGNITWQTVPAPGTRTRGADGIAGALRGPNVGAVDDDRGMAAEYLRRLLAFVEIGACSVAVNGLVAGPGSPAVAFELLVLLLGGLFLVILHVLRV